MNYDVNYFLRKFEAIPGKLWCTYTQTNGKGQCCTLGHTQDFEFRNQSRPECKSLNDEGLALRSLFDLHLGDDAVVRVNNGVDARYQQPTPKQRILAALRDIQAMEQKATPEVKERIVYVSVDEKVRELSRAELSEQ